MPFHLIKTYIRNPEIEIKLFLCPSTSSDTDGCAADTSAHIYAHGGAFSELGINGNLGWETVGEDFFCFCQKNKNGNLRWGTLGDALICLEYPFKNNCEKILRYDIKYCLAKTYI